MAMDLSRRDEQGVMEAMARVAVCEAWEDPAGADGDCGVDRVDSIGEARAGLVEPVALTPPRWDCDIGNLLMA